MGEALKLQQTVEYSSAVAEIEDCNEDAAQNTETSGLYLQGFGFITQRSVASHGSEIEDTATGIKYAVIYIEWQQIYLEG